MSSMHSDMISSSSNNMNARLLSSSSTCLAWHHRHAMATNCRPKWSTNMPHEIVQTDRLRMHMVSQWFCGWGSPIPFAHGYRIATFDTHGHLGICAGSGHYARACHMKRGVPQLSITANQRVHAMHNWVAVWNRTWHNPPMSQNDAMITSSKIL